MPKKPLTKFSKFMIKILKNMGIEGTYLNIVKVIYINLQQTLFSMLKN